MSQPSRYRPEQPPDYSHRFHAGNIGDVWKHLVLVEVLRRAQGGGRPITYVDSHAGEGVYALGPTGEWTEAIGKLWAAERRTDEGEALARYVDICHALGRGGSLPERYAGSPIVARAVLGPDAELRLFERDPAACERLRRELGDSPAARVECADGLAALASTVRAAEARGRVVALVDPPFTQKTDWTVVPDRVIEAARASPGATLLLWYPLKSLTRPNAMIARCKAARLPASIAEIVTTPLEHQRQRLNGSGVLLVRPPDGTLEAIAAAAVQVGEQCATRPGVWSLRVASW